METIGRDCGENEEAPSAAFATSWDARGTQLHCGAVPPVPPLGLRSLGRTPCRRVQTVWAVLSTACTPTPVSETPKQLATASSANAAPAPVAGSPTGPAVVASVELDQVPMTQVRSANCSVDVLPASLGTAVGGWLDAFRLMNADGFSFQAPSNDADARVVLLNDMNCEEGNCDGSFLPIALSVGEDPYPRGYRLGIVEASHRGMFVYGPWDAGVQIYHCIPHVSADVHPPNFDGSVQHVSVQSVQPDVVGVSADGECEPGTPDCNIGCFPQHVWRFDLYASTAGEARLLIAQERSLPDDTDSQTRLLQSLPPTFRPNDVALLPCSDGEAGSR